jgi:hypothetical protein
MPFGQAGRRSGKWGAVRTGGKRERGFSADQAEVRQIREDLPDGMSSAGRNVFKDYLALYPRPSTQALIAR